MKDKVYSAGEILFKEGDLGDSFFQIVEGTAGAYLHYGQSDERKLRDMLPGQFFGEMAIIEAWPRSTTVVAETELRVLEISGDALNEYFTDQPDKVLALMKQIGSRIRMLTDDYNEVNEFIRQKDSEKNKKSEGFLARLFKFRQGAAMAKDTGAVSEESLLRLKYDGKPGDSGLKIEKYNRGQVIFREGEDGVFMYMVQFGSVSVYTGFGSPQQKKLTTLNTNTFLGEMGMLEGEKRSATAVVEEDDTILEVIRPEDLEKLFKTNPVMVDMILVHLSSRLRKLTKDYAKACQEAVADL